MSARERAIQLLDQIPEGKLYYIIGILEGAAIPDDTPNDETLAAFAEGDKMLETGTGLRFEGSTEDLFQSLLGD